ncbi:MAG: crossover junction endodeoxyribonuclease RuvC [Patescibacteria group bacterium]|nr:crossover junction endodeoxyribonuclease RuvC [Patescibacteria group bacterium]MDE2172870.1 crossover junction endodeoxyribonuclease RuvC [Patescibacteria group bacterium]
MTILGIDPGYDRLGIAVIEKTAAPKERLIYSACFQTSPKDDIYERLMRIGAEIVRVCEKYRPDVLGIENLFLAKNQKTAMRVSETRGIIIYEAARRHIPIYEYSPMEIKMSVTGDGTSDKSRIIKMVSLLIELPKKKIIDDEYDALAVALTCSARQKSNPQ